MATTPTESFWQALQRRVASTGGDPLVTFYDERTTERVELSGTTYANWVAKTASLLQDELDLERGGSVVVDLPVHWLGPVWLGAAWSLGAEVVDASYAADSGGPVDVVVCGPGQVERYAAEGAANHVVACSLLPMGARFATPPPAPVLDFGVVVWSQPDSLLLSDPPQPQDVAWRDGQGTIDQAGVLASAAATDRVLSTTPATSRPGTALVAAAVRTGQGVVWVAGTETGEQGRARLEQLARSERARLL